MTTVEMPLILDNAMDEVSMQVDLDDVDDLFGDGVPLALPPRPPSKRLHQRLDELRRTGSCQGVAWSKTGTIASIAPGGHSLELRYLCVDPKTAQWGLSDSTHFTPSTSFPGGPITHLTWSPTNTASELAVIDSVGRTSIFNFSTNLNRPSRVRGWDTDPVDDLHAVVGTYWLNLMPTHASKVHPLYSLATKAGDKYNYEPSFVPISGPYHPNPSRSALITVTTRGLLKMFWYQANGRLEETKIDLESVTSADDLITHASICSDMKRAVLFVALMTQSKQLRVVHVKILWDGSKSESQQAQQQPPNRPLNPSLSVKHVAVSTWLNGEQGSLLDSAMPKVSLLEFLPTSPNQATKKMAAPVIIAVRSFVPTLSSPYNQEMQSSIDVWELQADSQQNVHPAFEKLGARRSSVGQPNQDPLCLRKLDSIVVDKVIIGITQVPLGKSLCFAYNDGTVEYRDRFTLQPMYNEVNLDRITSLLEVGFDQDGGSGCLQNALSPTTLSVIQMDEAGKLNWHSLRYSQDTSMPLSGGQLSSVIAAMTMNTAQSAYAQINIDDLLAISRNFKGQPGFSSQWMAEVVKLSKIIVDYAEEVPHDHLFRNNQLQLFFSILNHIGWNGTSRPRDFQSKLSTIALNLRNIVILITIANNNTHAAGKGPTPMDDTEVVSALAGCCKWSIDLLSWLCDSLFCLEDDEEFMAMLGESPPPFAKLTEYLHKKNDVALHMIMCSSIRGLLNAVCRRMTLLDNLSVMALKYYESRAGKDEPVATPGAPTGAKGGSYGSPLHQAYQRIQRHTSSAMVKISDFDALLNTFATAVRSVYKTSMEQLNKQQQQQLNSNNANAANKEDAGTRARATAELTLLLGGPPPPTFQEPLTRLFKQDLPKLRDTTDAARLFFADYTLLEIDDEDPKALERKRAGGRYVDMFKRVEIVKGAHGGSVTATRRNGGADDGNGGAPVQWRMCVRCASVMEDFGPVHNRPNLAFVLSQQRNCSCGGRMVLLPLGEGGKGK